MDGRHRGAGRDDQREPGEPDERDERELQLRRERGGSSFECQLDGGGYAACTSPQSYSSLADGSHTFEVKATDPAGNTSSPADSTWAVDTTPPELPTLVGPRDRERTNSLWLGATFRDTTPSGLGTMTFRVCSDGNCATVIATGTSDVLGNGVSVSWNMPALVADGTYFWQAMAQDLLGNATGWTATAGFTLDRSPPRPPSSPGASATTA